MKKTLGGDRLGAGRKMQVDLHTYNRSTHDLSFIMRTTMSAGTLVPFLVEVGLPGDTFDIDISAYLNTLPTIGPLFGSYKLQIDLFKADIRLYQGKLHQNQNNVGLNMNTIKLPVINFPVPSNDDTFKEQISDLDNSQINPSCILNYLGIRGGGIAAYPPINPKREFNATSWLAYWDIYKNYYANKQEEVGYVVHTTYDPVAENVSNIKVDPGAILLDQYPTATPILLHKDSTIQIFKAAPGDAASNVTVWIDQYGWLPILQIATIISEDDTQVTLAYKWQFLGNRTVRYWQYYNGQENVPRKISLKKFQLSDIDDMKMAILANAPNAAAFDVTAQTLDPYQLLWETTGADDQFRSVMESQEGLGIKTYNSDLFNNWIKNEWIDEISSRSAIDTSGGSFTIDTFIFGKKLWEMLNRIAVSGGSYDDYIDAVYTIERMTKPEIPIFMGGLSQEIVFQEVIATAQDINNGTTGDVQPLGTLAGKGKLAQNKKGGKITIKVQEYCYIMGIVSITPRIDYSQGNTWDVHLKTMDDFHKPALDQIGFQDFITEKAAWWDTYQDSMGVWQTKSAGKQPAWLDYMTNYNRVKGNFAIPLNSMFMVLTRQYTPSYTAGMFNIEDMTTYIDPAKYNNIFAESSLDCQNFWVQIGAEMTVRRLMSAKLMPNL